MTLSSAQSLSLKSPNAEVNLIAGYIPLDYIEIPQHASNTVIKITSYFIEKQMVIRYHLKV